MDKTEILKSLEPSFSGVPYPHQRDFYQAIAHRDYEDYVDLGKKKKWNEVTKSELKKYYDFIYYLDRDAAVYYFPTYIKLILENSESNKEDEHFIEQCSGWFSSLITSEKLFDCRILDTNQFHTVCDFLKYCRDIIYPRFGFDTECLHEALERLTMNTELYDALRSAGADEVKARAAAYAVGDFDFNKIATKSDICLLRRMVGFNLILTLVILATLVLYI